MIVDPITDEIRAIRQALAAQYDNDLNRILLTFRKRMQHVKVFPAHQTS